MEQDGEQLSARPALESEGLRFLHVTGESPQAAGRRGGGGDPGGRCAVLRGAPAGPGPGAAFPSWSRSSQSGGGVRPLYFQFIYFLNWKASSALAASAVPGPRRAPPAPPALAPSRRAPCGPPASPCPCSREREWEASPARVGPASLCPQSVVFVFPDSHKLLFFFLFRACARAVGSLLAAYGWYLVVGCVLLWAAVQKLSARLRASGQRRPDPAAAAAAGSFVPDADCENRGCG